MVGQTTHQASTFLHSPSKIVCPAWMMNSINGSIFLQTRFATFSNRQNFLKHWQNVNSAFFKLKRLCKQNEIQKEKKYLDPKHRRLLSISSISSITLNISRTSPVLGSNKAKRLPARHTPCQQPRDAQKHHETDDSARSKNCFKLQKKKDRMAWQGNPAVIPSDSWTSRGQCLGLNSCTSA